MLIVLSPAKKLDFESDLVTKRGTQPGLLAESQKLIELLRKKNVGDVKKLMGLSDNLATLNHQRYQDYSTKHTAKNARPAILAFSGDVYAGMEAETFGADAFDFAQDHLRILSGLYGCLRPMDRIQPHRLEMGTKLANASGKDLYAFWGNQIAMTLNKSLKKQGDDVLVNLASNEYFKSANPGAKSPGSKNPSVLKARVLTPVFKEEKAGKLRVLSFFAKKARGRMAGWMIRQQVSKPDQIKEFKVDGYSFNAEASSGDQWVFSRKQPVPSKG